MDAHDSKFFRKSKDLMKAFLNFRNFWIVYLNFVFSDEWAPGASKMKKWGFMDFFFNRNLLQ